MLQLELLWNLQDIDKEIARVKKNMKDRTTYNKLKIIRDEYNSIKEGLDKSSNELDTNTKKAARLNVDLKCQDQKLKEDTERLYIEGTNAKIIENIQKEIENCKKQIDDIENELLKLMERNESLGSIVKEDREILFELKTRFETLKRQHSEDEEKNKGELTILEKRREDILKEVDSMFLNQYNGIASKKSNPVAFVNSGVCTGCGVKLNAMLYDALKKKNSICLCEHCGRILYFE